ncbi:DNA segregation ATPase and related proteins (FtsK/SpoIIIE family) [Bifidobacterium callimiconis]|uniref:DNA segregation ATPase and related proteins (FtsK/SpoIIIE family) n=2 Tax=Bifidobacterium callimiconis TaxID=2306973 RepID=A0A430FI56_9BIFI|nr:DNA segregation ATPase and related proteins (FtsK/SpoIIIE family) [Bifidobacterium callimiconis]
MLVMMIIERRWMFVGLIVPGLIGCLASALANIAMRRRARSEAEDNTPNALSDELGGGFGASQDDRDAEAARQCAAMHMELEELLGMEAKDVPSAWKVMARRWERSRCAQDRGDRSLLASLHTVPVGIGPTGVFTINMPKQGPHALVAGTTGSGKSVLLESWCLSLASRFPPSMLNFVFLDFKGGSAFRVLHRLPHTVGFVSDLDLKHAVRALRAMELELKRREMIVSRAHVADVNELKHPPARIVVVIDEFHALKRQLPDYLTQLTALAALGRSLGMHLIACTQNPLGQVSGEMKANIGLNICLRVRDPMQSSELLGSKAAALISPQAPGVAFAYGGEEREAFRCAVPVSSETLTRGGQWACRFLGEQTPPPLFSPPLPQRIDAEDETIGTGAEPDAPLYIGVADTGVTLEPLLLPLDLGNIAIVGSGPRGKTTILSAIARLLSVRDGVEAMVTVKTPDGYVTTSLPTTNHASEHEDPSPTDARPRTRIWLVDDADDLLDPMGRGAEHDDFQEALADSHRVVIFTLNAARHLRFPDHCGVRLVFPTGDRAIDMMAGVPTQVLAQFDGDDVRIPGRAVLLVQGAATPVQCHDCAPFW